MPRHLILHIGLTKTGSTSIQHVLAVRRQALQDQGVYVPTSPGWANHGLLAAYLVNDKAALERFHPVNWGGLSPATRLAVFRADWDREMAAMPGWATRCLITAEQIGMLLHSDDEVSRLAALLRPHFGSVQVIVYLRRQDLHAASYYNQWLRAGRLDPPSLPEGGPESLPENDYGALLDRYARVFGAAAVSPRIYDRRELLNGDVLDDFLHTAGLTLEVPADIARRHANAGLSATGQDLLRAIGARMAARAGGAAWYHAPEWHSLAESVTACFPGAGWRPEPAAAAAFLARFAASNERARARFFPDRWALFAPDAVASQQGGAVLQAEAVAPGAPGPPAIGAGAAPRLETAAAAAREDVMTAALDLVLHEMAASNQRMAQAFLAEYRLMRRLEDHAGMRLALLRVIKHAPELVFARVRLAGLLIQDGSFAAAREHLEVARRLAPQGPAVHNLARQLDRAIRAAASGTVAPTGRKGPPDQGAGAASSDGTLRD